MNTTTQNQNENQTDYTPEMAFQYIAKKAKKSHSYHSKEEVEGQRLHFSYSLCEQNEDGTELKVKGVEGYETLESLYEDLHDQLLDNEQKRVIKIEIMVNKCGVCHQDCVKKEISDIKFKKVRAPALSQSVLPNAPIKYEMIAVEVERDGVCVPIDLEEAEARVETIRRRSEEAEEQLRLGMEEVMEDALSGSDLSEEEVAFQDVD